jgi:hypothetical protein
MGGKPPFAPDFCASSVIVTPTRCRGFENLELRTAEILVQLAGSPGCARLHNSRFQSSSVDNLDVLPISECDRATPDEITQ